PGVYTRNRPIASGTQIQKNINIIGTGPGVIMSAAENQSALTWTLQSGGTYQATRSSVGNGLDGRTLSSWGVKAVRIPAACLANCNGTAGSWWTDNVTVYVHRADNSTINTDVWTIMSATGTCLQVFGGVNVYVEGVDFEGANVTGVGYANNLAGPALPTV